VTRHTGQTVDSRDVDAALALLDRLSDAGTPVAALTIRHDELVVETPPDVTPAEGIAVLREIEDDPAAGVRQTAREPGRVELVARVLGRRTRICVLRRRVRAGA
jgi:hypothetical protein